MKKIILLKKKRLENIKSDENLDDSYCFIITRHVRSKLTNKYWIECCKCIRKFYDNPIFIIDDNSNKEYLANEQFENTTIIESEYKGAGEFLPFYYMLKLKLSKKAIIIHDSCFLQRKLPTLNNKVHIFWTGKHIFDSDKTILEKLNYLNNNELIDFFSLKKKWKICFGVIMSINYDFLVKLEENYSLTKLKNIIKTRKDRQDFERIIGLMIFHFELTNLNKVPKLLFGGIRNYCKFGLNYKDYLNKKHNGPIFKVWTGR